MIYSCRLSYKNHIVLLLQLSYQDILFYDNLCGFSQKNLYILFFCFYGFLYMIIFYIIKCIYDVIMIKIHNFCKIKYY